MASRAGHFARGCLALPQKKHLMLAAEDAEERSIETSSIATLCSLAADLNEGTDGAQYSSEFFCVKANDLA